jgi:hypothetical protein
MRYKLTLLEIPKGDLAMFDNVDVATLNEARIPLSSRHASHPADATLQDFSTLEHKTSQARRRYFIHYTSVVEAVITTTN